MASAKEKIDLSVDFDDESLVEYLQIAEECLSQNRNPYHHAAEKVNNSFLAQCDRILHEYEPLNDVLRQVYQRSLLNGLNLIDWEEYSADGSISEAS